MSVSRRQGMRAFSGMDVLGGAELSTILLVVKVPVATPSAGKQAHRKLQLCPGLPTVDNPLVRIESLFAARCKC